MPMRESVTIEKIVALHTSLDPAISEPGLAAKRAIAHAGSFDDILAAHRAVMAKPEAGTGVLPSRVLRPRGGCLLGKAARSALIATTMKPA